MSEQAIEPPVCQESAFERFSVHVFAIAYIYVGVAAIVAMAATILSGRHFCFDFNFLGLFIGKGLLDRSALWRRFAVFLAWFGVICAPPALVLSLLIDSDMPSGAFLFQGVSQPFTVRVLVFCQLLALFLLALWQQRVLSRDAVKAAFAERPAHNGLWLPIAVIVLCLLVKDAIEDHLLWRFLKQVDSYAATVELFDAQTGAQLNPSICLKSRSPNDDIVFPKVKTCLVGSTPSHLEVSWVGVGNATIDVSAVGYQEKEVELPTYSRSRVIRVIRVELQRLPEKEEPSAH